MSILRFSQKAMEFHWKCIDNCVMTDKILLKLTSYVNPVNVLQKI